MKESLKENICNMYSPLRKCPCKGGGCRLTEYNVVIVSILKYDGRSQQFNKIDD